MERRKFFKVVLGGSVGATGLLIAQPDVPKLELKIGSIIRVSFGRGEGLGLSSLCPTADVTYFSLRRDMLEADGKGRYKPGPTCLAFRYTTALHITPFTIKGKKAYSIRAVQVGSRFDEYRVESVSECVF